MGCGIIMGCGCCCICICCGIIMGCCICGIGMPIMPPGGATMTIPCAMGRPGAICTGATIGLGAYIAGAIAG